jgi:hypothetical protein
MPKAPPGAAQGGPLDGSDERMALEDMMRPLQDPNPERFKQPGPLFPKGPPDTQGDTSEDEKKRRRDRDPAMPYLGS